MEGWRRSYKMQMLTLKNQESKASLKAYVTNNDPYYPYNQELFGHDEASTPDLGEN